MTLRPDSRSRNRTRTRIRSTRLLSPCYRHPDEPVTGICPSCLRERLSGLDPSTTAVNVGSAAPGLRRCRSVVGDSEFEGSSSNYAEPRRKSCDVVPNRSSLCNLFDVDDVKIGSDVDTRVESKNLGLSRVTYTVVDSERRDGELRVSGEKLGVLHVDSDIEEEEEEEDGEFRTMKEHIDLDFPSQAKKSKDFRQIAGSLFGKASVFSKKLRKWGQKNSSNKSQLGSNDAQSVAGSNANHKSFENQYRNEILGRRSCDTDPRFSVDGGRISFDEPRASWDGYMIARTIPRLAPMFSGVENGILGNVNRFENHRLSVDVPMDSIMEDESSYGMSGNSNSDSSSSMKGASSFDRSSSVRSFRRKLPSSEDHGVSRANPKLVITEKELKDWHLNSHGGEEMEKPKSLSRDTPTATQSKPNMPPRKSMKWRNVFGFKPKDGEMKSQGFNGTTIDPLIDDIGEKQDLSGWKLTRNSSVAGSRNQCDNILRTENRRKSVDSAIGWSFRGKQDLDKSGKYCSTGLDDGIPPFYMTPLRSLRRSKSGKFKLQNVNSFSGHVLQLN